MKTDEIIKTLAIAQASIKDGNQNRASDLIRTAIEGLKKPYPEYESIEKCAAEHNRARASALDPSVVPPGWEHDGFVYDRGETIPKGVSYMTRPTGRSVYHLPYDVPADGGEYRVKRKKTVRKLAITDHNEMRQARDGVKYFIGELENRSDFIGYEYADGSVHPTKTVPGKIVRRAMYVLLDGRHD